MLSKLITITHNRPYFLERGLKKREPIWEFQSKKTLPESFKTALIEAIEKNIDS